MFHVFDPLPHQGNGQGRPGDLHRGQPQGRRDRRQSVPARLSRHLPALRLPAAAVAHDPHRRTRFRPVAQGHLGRSARLHRRQAQAHHQKARRPERGPDRADQLVHPREQDVSQSHRLAQPLHPRRLVQGLGQHGLPLAFRVHRRPDGDRLQEHQAHRHVWPQPVRGHRGQGGQQPHGRHGGGRQGDLHRPARFHHRHQGPPLLDDPARHGLGAELRPHARNPQGAALRRRVRGEVGARPERAAGFRAAPTRQSGPRRKPASRPPKSWPWRAR